MVNEANTAWVMISTVLVLFMTLPALALFYAGLVRSKNILSVLMHCMAIACSASLLWLIVGYSLAFSDGNGLIGGLDKAFLLNVGRETLMKDSGLPETVFFMFQGTFAIITPALIVGAYVERIKFAAVLVFSSIWLLVVYAPVTHWVWGGGWLADMGVMDFAGGIVVHVTAGISALVIAVMLGKRRGFPSHIQPPHAPWMVMIGASMLWVGWFGFNAGSALSAGFDAGMALLVTHMSAATGSLVWMVIEWKRFGKPSLVGIVTGTIAGLATITPASGYVGPMAAVLLGLSGGFICYVGVDLIRNRFGIDDSLDVLAVHGIGGALGTLLLVFLVALPGGTSLADGQTVVGQFGVQAIGVASVALWSAGASFVIIKFCQMTVGLRVDEQSEIEGLDYTSHGETGYNL